MSDGDRPTVNHVPICERFGTRAPFGNWYVGSIWTLACDGLFVQAGTGMARHGLSDGEWVVFEGEFLPPKRTGGTPMPARQAFDGVCRILRAGARRRDLPKEPGLW